ncbi:DUF1800 domain-containing protein [Cupriavidus basilensis]|uniref:DUF1800 domain-containing protein n=1 Tax=Cupriavidus basilensis TaxID=68895 RepID=A0ABT6AUT7_9BURK|nr:DUF1800 domain-containing protein [Cupriavidus basilensis]MDF3836365.1 DUF1800 domain-containing protein [Cupriavidus basilensis]
MTFGFTRLMSALVSGSVACLLGACALGGDAQTGGAPGAALKPADLHWLNSVTFGANQASIDHLRKVGRERFLDEQLKAPATDTGELAAAIGALSISRQSAEQRLLAVRAEQQRINTLTDPDEKQKASQALGRTGNDVLIDTSRRHLLRALYSPAQLREQMTWFWMNHFSVHSGKGTVRWVLADYEDKAVRAHALGRFRDLLMATVTSPAMLDYLDNAQSAVNRINENYARELMELHTLGVSGGPSGSRYTQQDVQELARILTGLGVSAGGQPPKLPPQKQALYRANGLFEFNPNRHDFGPKVFLGRRIEPTGFHEVEQAVDLLSRDPATARFISYKLAAYFVADTPPPALVDRMAGTFAHSDGDIAAVLRTMFLSPEMNATEASGTRKFKDPMRFVVSSLRLAYDGRTVANLRPAINWLNQLGEPLYGRITPDGYPAAESAWASSGQMVKRFEIARTIGSGQAGLFTGDDGKPAAQAGFPLLSNRVFFDSIEPMLGPATRHAMAQATSQAEWNTILLSSPDWMQD